MITSKTKTAIEAERYHLYSFRYQNFKLERFSAEKEAVNNNSTGNLIQPTIDEHLDPLGFREWPSCDENRLVTHNDTTNSGQIKFVILRFLWEFSGEPMFGAWKNIWNRQLEIKKIVLS